MKPARWLALVALGLLACKKKQNDGNPTPPTTPTPTAAIDAAPTPPPAIDAAPAPPPAIDAAAPAAAMVMTDAGFGPLTGFQQSADGDDATLTLLQNALPGLDVSFQVADLGEDMEEGYWSAKKGDAEQIQIWRGDGQGVMVELVGPMFGNSDGVKPGDKLSALAAKRSDLTCVDRGGNDRLGTLQCTSAREPHVTYVVVATNWKGKGSDKGTPVDVAKLADRAIFAIAR